MSSFVVLRRRWPAMPAHPVPHVSPDIKEGHGREVRTHGEGTMRVGAPLGKQ
ncbi:hypothetical protein TorRG33x02_287980, partial [Trema orientale]